jgi:hypothetical protein
VLPPPLADAADTSHKPPNKVLIASKTMSSIAKLHTSNAMTFSATVFTMEIKTPTCPIISTFLVTFFVVKS